MLTEFSVDRNVNLIFINNDEHNTLLTCSFVCTCLVLNTKCTNGLFCYTSTMLACLPV